MDKGLQKQNFQKEFFLMEQKKQKVSINLQEGLNNDFTRLRAFVSRKVWQESVERKESFRGMHPHLWDSMQFLYMKDDVGYEEPLAAVYEAENKGTER